MSEIEQQTKQDAALLTNRSIQVYGAFCDAGNLRPLNEDAYSVDVERQLFGVADGYGGNGVGDVAAKFCLERINFFVKTGLGDSEVTLPFVYRSYYSNNANLLFNAFLFANHELFFENKKQHVNGRGGASVLTALFSGRHMTMASVGLCQAYLIRRGRVQSLLRPRSYNAMRGTFQGSWNPSWAFPLMSMGHAPDLEPEIFEFQVEKNDLLVLATDGVYPRLSDEDFTEFYQILVKTKALDLGVSEQNRRLAEIATQKGNVDNQALITLLCA